METTAKDLTLIGLRAMRPADAAAVLRIYQEGIDTGMATFAEAAPDWADWDRTHLPHSRVVATADKTVVGWAALSPTSARDVYRGVVEISIYVAERAGGAGVGGALLTALINRSEAAGVWTLQAAIFPENAASIVLHRSRGFRPLGIRRRVGLMRHGPHAGEWRDIVFLERRSECVGVAA